MSECSDLPIHQRTRLLAIGTHADGRHIWPIVGGAEDGPTPRADVAGAVSTGTQVQDADSTESETVDYWKRRAREHERDAKLNASAPTELTTFIDSVKGDAERTAERFGTAEAELATLPEKVAAHLKDHLVDQFKIKAEDAKLFLTATAPELLIRQADGLISRMNENASRNHVPREGHNPISQPDISYNVRGFLREMFDNPD